MSDYKEKPKANVLEEVAINRNCFIAGRLKHGNLFSVAKDENGQEIILETLPNGKQKKRWNCELTAHCPLISNGGEIYGRTYVFETYVKVNNKEHNVKINLKLIDKKTQGATKLSFFSDEANATMDVLLRISDFNLSYEEGEYEKDGKRAISRTYEMLIFKDSVMPHFREQKAKTEVAEPAQVKFEEPAESDLPF